MISSVNSYASSTYGQISKYSGVTAQTSGEGGEEAINTDGSANSQTKEQKPDLELITRLKARDAEVRAHENAHRSVGGDLTGPASFTYQTGPDGISYAIGGEVSIDMSPEGDHKATQSKMQRVKAAAMAPAEPSAQDIKVASTATMLEAKAKMDEMKEKTEEAKKAVKEGALKKYEEAQKSSQ